MTTLHLKIPDRARPEKYPLMHLPICPKMAQDILISIYTVTRRGQSGLYRQILLALASCDDEVFIQAGGA